MAQRDCDLSKVTNLMAEPKLPSRPPGGVLSCPLRPGCDCSLLCPDSVRSYASCFYIHPIISNSSDSQGILNCFYALPWRFWSFFTTGDAPIWKGSGVDSGIGVEWLPLFLLVFIAVSILSWHLKKKKKKIPDSAPHMRDFLKNSFSSTKMLVIVTSDFKISWVCVSFSHFFFTDFLFQDI